jgi:hypothetical protein
LVEVTVEVLEEDVLEEKEVLEQELEDVSSKPQETIKSINKRRTRTHFLMAPPPFLFIK